MNNKPTKAISGYIYLNEKFFCLKIFVNMSRKQEKTKHIKKINRIQIFMSQTSTIIYLNMLEGGYSFFCANVSKELLYQHPIDSQAGKAQAKHAKQAEKTCRYNNICNGLRQRLVW